MGALLVQRADGMRFHLGSGLSDAQRADTAETSANPRARSAVLRVAEKLEVAA